MTLSQNRNGECAVSEPLRKSPQLSDCQGQALTNAGVSVISLLYTMFEVGSAGVLGVVGLEGVRGLRAAKIKVVEC